MKLKNCFVQNFGSYKELSFDYSEPGLFLFKGATGSGKTTFLDIPIWILFGTTSKNGNVDEVRSWFNLEANTYGELEVELPTGTIMIHRTRGTSKVNDLYFVDETQEVVRGKDLIETQKLLSAKLGISPEVFSLASYFNEFSEASSFFYAPSKDRRKLFEKITNLSFIKSLVEKLTEERKRLKKSLLDQSSIVDTNKGRLEQANDSLEELKVLESTWSDTQRKLVSDLERKSKSFESEKSKKIDILNNKVYKFESDRTKQIADIIDKIDGLDAYIKPVEDFDKALDDAEKRAKKFNTFCQSCKQLLPSMFDAVAKISDDRIQNLRLMDKRALYVQEVEKARKAINPYSESLKSAKLEKNHYIIQLEQEKYKINPFSESIIKHLQQVLKLESLYNISIETRKSDSEKTERVNFLLELAGMLRSKMLLSSIKQVEHSMNDIIRKHFDSEFSVEMTPNENDALDIVINKSGYFCYYTQLSKGQRQILKLSFAVSLMKLISNEYSTSFESIFFDEPSDGLDETLKYKCVDILNELLLDRTNIFVVEHSTSVHPMYENQYLVELVEDESRVTNLTVKPEEHKEPHSDLNI